MKNLSNLRAETKAITGSQTISVFKLTEFNSSMTEGVFSLDGVHWEAIKVRKTWYLTGNYAY